MGHLEAQFAQFRYDVGSDTDPQFRVEAQVGGETAVLAEVIGYLLL